MRAVTVLFVLVAAGCSSNPASPSLPSVNVSGTVYDLSFRPLPGARVQFADAGPSDAPAVTAANGVFTLRGPGRPQPYVLRVEKEGYVTQEVDCCDINLARVGEHGVPNGSYTLTVAIDPACTFVPPALQTQSFPATVRLLRVTSSSQPIWGVSIENGAGTERAGTDLVLIASDGTIAAGEESAMFWEVPLARYFSVGLFSTEPLDPLNLSFSFVLNYCHTTTQSRMPWNEFRCTTFFGDAPDQYVIARGACVANNRATLRRSSK